MRARRRLLPWVISGLALPLGASAPARAEGLVAVQLDPETAIRLAPGGDDAVGGAGDWLLSNGVLCAVVTDPGQESDFSANGGALVDLAHCGQGDDQLGVAQPLFNLGRRNTLRPESIRPEVDADTARLRVRSRRGGVRLDAVYALDRADPERLRIRLSALRETEGETLRWLGFIWLHPRGSLRMFRFAGHRPQASDGFLHPHADPASLVSIVGSFRRADLHVFVPEDAAAAPISYGLHLVSATLRRADGTSEALTGASTTGADHTLFTVFSEPFWVGGDEVGWLELAQSALMDLAPGDRLEVVLDVPVGRRNDVASISDRIHADAPRIRGRVDDPTARVTVTADAGWPLTVVRPDPDGAFAFRAPPGRYTLVATTPDGRRVERRVVQGSEDLALVPIALGGPARLRLPEGHAMRLVFRGQGDTPDPLLGGDGLDVRVGTRAPPTSTASPDVSLAGRPGDPRVVVLPPGRYRVYATRGPEFSLSEAEVELVAGETSILEIDPPRRVLETPGLVAADLHVHAGASWDTALPLDTRLRSFLAQGAEVLVLTEHNRIVDPGPALDALGASAEVLGIPGVEITSTEPSDAAPHSFGHANAFPVAPRPAASRDGAPPAQGRRLRSALAALRADAPGALLQLNHPRSVRTGIDPGALFTHLSVPGEPFDPTRPLDAAPNAVLLERDPRTGLRDLDFDALELWNGPGLGPYRALRADWFALLLQGSRPTATANSDSHRLAQVVALPRSYVAVPEDRPGTPDPGQLVAALRAGRVFGTNGPLPILRLGDAAPGDVFTGRTGRLVLRVDAADWVPVARARIFVDGELVAAPPIRPGETVSLELSFDRDGFVMAEAEGDADPRFRAIAGSLPFAFTNPIRVDADGDGRWAPEGLPDPLPPALARPASLPPFALPDGDAPSAE